MKDKPIGYTKNKSTDFILKPVDFSLSRNPVARYAATGFSRYIGENSRENQKRKDSFHFQLASFFKFMAANLSFTHFVTWAKPLYCV